MTGMIKALIALLVLGLIGAGGYYVHSQGAGKAPPQRTAGIPPVIVEAIGKRELVDQIEAVGTTYALESVVLTAPVTDPVVEIRFSDGQRVRKGDVLVALDTSVIRAQLASAKATLEEAEKQLERTRTLATRGTAAETRLDEQERIRNTAQAEVERYEAELARRMVRAPFDGIVGLRRVSVGTLVQPGTELITIQDTSVLKLDFSVPELFFPSLRPGQEIIARTPALPGRTFTGTVSAVDPRVDPVARAVTVRALLPNPDGALTSGMLMTVNLIRERANVLMVPEEAMISLADRRYVFRLNGDDTVSRIPVATGRRIPGYIEITGGLNEKDVIIVDGVIRARDGGKVKPQLRASNGGTS